MSDVGLSRMQWCEEGVSGVVMASHQRNFFIIYFGEYRAFFYAYAGMILRSPSTYHSHKKLCHATLSPPNDTSHHWKTKVRETRNNVPSTSHLLDHIHLQFAVWWVRALIHRLIQLVTFLLSINQSIDVHKYTWQSKVSCMGSHETVVSALPP